MAEGDCGPVTMDTACAIDAGMPALPISTGGEWQVHAAMLIGGEPDFRLAIGMS